MLLSRSSKTEELAMHLYLDRELKRLCKMKLMIYFDLFLHVWIRLEKLCKEIRRIKKPRKNQTIKLICKKIIH